MTSQEIREEIKKVGQDSVWEIAYQLAKMNERNEAGDSEGVNRLLRKVGLADPEPGKRDAPSEPSPIRGGAYERGYKGPEPNASDGPIGWRCGGCNYGRDFSDAMLKTAGRTDLEGGFCPACGAEDLRIVFGQPGVSEPSTETGPTLKQWRTGARVMLNVYDGDRPVCQCHDVTDALDIVRAMNELIAKRAKQEAQNKY